MGRQKDTRRIDLRSPEHYLYYPSMGSGSFNDCLTKIDQLEILQLPRRYTSGFKIQGRGDLTNFENGQDYFHRYVVL